MFVMALPSHADDDSTTQGCTDCGNVVQPRARSIEVLSQREEVKLACQSSLIFMLTRNRVITIEIS
jgi:hypothetical protein